MRSKKYFSAKEVPAPSALPASASRDNARLVPDTPQVNSGETCKLFNAGVVAFAKSARSVDPSCYASAVG
jgi:hypothetical protein